MSTINISDIGSPTEYANANGHDAHLAGTSTPRLAKYLNTADLSQSTAFTLGSGPAYYNNLRRPGVNSMCSLVLPTQA
jgi:hypothetical protein